MFSVIKSVTIARVAVSEVNVNSAGSAVHRDLGTFFFLICRFFFA